MLNKSKNLIAVIVAVAVVSLGAYLWYLGNGKENGTIQSSLVPEEAADKALSFINENLLPDGVTASLVNVLEENGVYKFKMKIDDQEYDSYVTKDGKLFFVEGIDLDKKIEAPETPDIGGDVTKEEKPDVKVFIMSYCPYGLQAQKMFLSVYNLLGEKADMGIYFVNYIMHGEDEINENTFWKQV